MSHLYSRHASPSKQSFFTTTVANELGTTAPAAPALKGVLLVFPDVTSPGWQGSGKALHGDSYSASADRSVLLP